MNINELLEMSREDMLAYLETKGDQCDFRKSLIEDIRDHIIDEYEPDCEALHSEARDCDYPLSHPNETMEEFDSHEEHESRECD